MNQLMDLGLNDEEIKEILSSNPLWIEENIIEIINCLQLFFANNEIKDIIYNNPYVISRDSKDLNDTITYLLNNITLDEIISNPIILNYNVSELQEIN